MRTHPAIPSARALPTSISRWVRYALVVVCLSLVTAHARAQADGNDPCQRELASWLQTCAKQSKLALRARSCPVGRLVVAVKPSDGARFEIEVRSRTEGAFRSVAGFGVSPVGEFSDWSRESAARRDAFEAFVTCIRENPSLPLAASSVEPHDAAQIRPVASGLMPFRRVPWMLLSALLATSLWWWMRRRSFEAEIGVATPAAPGRDLARRARFDLRAPAFRRAAVFVALGAACFLYRWFVLPRGFFHQNGQGPLWIRQAIEDVFGTSNYGPGYAEVFGWLVRLVPTAPDTAVFVSLAAFSTAVPAMAFGLARRSGVHPFAAWTAAILLAAHPLFGRLAQSESYFGIGLLLLFAGACVLSSASIRSGLRAPSAWLGVLACGLMVAQAVRIHPVLWAPACSIPAVVLVQPGRWTRRLLQTLLFSLGLAGVVAATTGATLASILAGLRSHPLQPVGHLTVEPPGAAWWLVLIALAGVVYGARSRVRAGIATAVLVAGFVSIRATDVLRDNYPLVSHAVVLLWAPALLAAVAVLVQAATQRARRHRGKIQTAVVGLVGVLVTIPWWLDYTRVPTDQREQTWALAWRRDIERSATVTYLGRAGDRLIALPIYGQDEIVMRSGEPRPRSPDAGAPMYYYRSSLCSTKEGEPACADFERQVHVELIEERALPALGSHPWRPLGPGAVHVGLYRVGKQP